MKQEDIKTRKQLATYIRLHVASGAWGAKLPGNFDIPAYWADEPVDAHEVSEEIRVWKKVCGSAMS